jgi:hypothetical protein
MAEGGQVPAGGRLSEWISIGVLASSVPREEVDEAIAVTGKQAKRSDGKLPPHVMVYFAMAMALFAEDYEEVMVSLTGTLSAWGCWDAAWSVPTSGGITQARKRLGSEPVKELFARVAVPVADPLTRDAFVGPWRLMAIDGFAWDVPDTPGNAAAFGYAGSGANASAFPAVRVVTVSECASHAMVDAEIGPITGHGSGEQTLARRLYERLADDWLLIADRNFYSYDDWRRAAGGGGAQLLWRVKSDLSLPVLDILPDGSYSSVLINPRLRGQARNELIEAARAGADLDPQRAMVVRVIEYTVPDRDGDGKDELICLITTITDMRAAPAQVLAQAYHQRWEHETGNDQIKTHLRGPGKVLRSKSPDLVAQELYGYLLTHYAISALICRAATEADIDPDRVKFKRTVRLVRRQAQGPAVFSP